MDESLRTAARTGNISDLYALIHRNGNVLRRFDRVEFIDTPLHIAAEEGCIRFAMEMINLKPSFARKLNRQGLSPFHLAVKKGHREMVLRLVKIDKDLVRVRGKNGETPLHYISKVGNQVDLLNKFLKACPDCIRDVTTQNQTALHIAVENKRLNVLQVLTESLRKKDCYREVVNQKDEDGNTALHLAASNNQPEMLKLLLNCKADKHATNQAGLTAFDIAQQHNNREIITILRGRFIPMVSNFKYKLEKRIVKYVTKASSLIFHDMDNISSEDRSALLVILGLLLTATYQATLSPPGGVRQGDSYSKSTNIPEFPGESVMNNHEFLRFYIPTYLVFVVAFFLTIALLKPFPHGFKTAIQVLLACLAISFDQSLSYIAPPSFAYLIIKIFSAIIFILMVFMCLAYKVSKLSVSIVAFWIFFPFALLSGEVGVGLILALLLFLFLHDEFWKGTILVVGFSLFVWVGFHVPPFDTFIWMVVRFIGCWVFLSLCQFCINRCTRC